MTREESTVLCLDAAAELANRRTPFTDAVVHVLAAYLDQGQPVAWEEAVIGLAKSVVIA